MMARKIYNGTRNYQKMREDGTMKLAAAAQMRELDRQAIEERGISSLELMERAAEGWRKRPWGICPQDLANAGRRFYAAAETTAATAWRSR